jgi:hypothetical protein
MNLSSCGARQQQRNKIATPHPINLDCKVVAMVWLLALSLETAGGNSRTSANYKVENDVLTGAGSHSVSVSYAADDAVGEVSGITHTGDLETMVKHGFIGQLYEVSGLTILPSLLSMNENSSRQLEGRPLMNDSSVSASIATSVTWSLVSGPLAINTLGISTADTVYMDSSAAIEGSWAGFTNAFSINILDSDKDNFGSYAGDGLEDGWQVQFFGLNNPAAAPLLDPDGDGQNNRFEFLAGVTPTDPSSIFRWRVESAPDLSGKKRLSFSPVLVDRVYTIRYTNSLGSLPLQWSTLNPAPAEIIDASGERTVIDATSASESRRFYRLELTKP